MAETGLMLLPNWRPGPVGVGLGVGLAVTGLAAWAWFRRLREEELLEWEEVGKVDELILFPIKSGGGYNVQSGEATKYGLVVDDVGDRSFVVMMMSASKPTHVTSGMAPLLCTLLPKLEGGVLTLTPLEGDPVSVNFHEAMQKESVRFEFRGHQAFGWDCGDLVADWLCENMYKNSSPETRPRVRLMYVGDPEKLRRPAQKPPIFPFKQFRKGDMQVYHDACAFCLTSSSSLDDLNTRLTSPVKMSQMRPTIVVKGRPAFEEDLWAYVRIGRGKGTVQFRTLKPREACLRVNVNPATGEKQTEVLDTLRRYRVPPMPTQLAQHWSLKPFFGIHMALDIGGTVQVGDPVYAVRRKPEWLL